MVSPGAASLGTVMDAVIVPVLFAVTVTGVVASGAEKLSIGIGATNMT